MQYEKMGQMMLSQDATEAQAVQASEGRWPRICERARTTAAQTVRC
jgi:hypothetical protein